ncbi:MAG TPA: stage 0 sporulation family protein [Firmicutes bacterium]|nr:stage 0 sporulation family protein [Bacillota bacterium]
MDKKTEKTNSACSCPCTGENGASCAAGHNSSPNREAPPGAGVSCGLSPSGGALQSEDAQETGEAYTVIGVRFKRAGKIYYFDPADLQLQPGSEVIVETARGLEYGYVMVGPKQVSAAEITQPLKKVIRIATEQDRIQLAENKEKEKKAFTIGLEKISQHKLEMKLIDVEYTFDRNKIIFYFTADGRIDFRELVKDLASVFKTRIELRQIGVRDEAKMIGGLGVCGRSLCCATFLGDFEPVSIKMAKEQNLSLNPTKISGICGRLMCCLKFESDSYREAKNELPAIGATVSYQGRKGRVIEQDLLRETLIIAFSDEEKVEAALGEVEF